MPELPSYCNFRKVNQNPHFLKKCERADQGKFLKNRPKSSPRLKGVKALAQMALSSNYNAVKLQRLGKILGQKSGCESARMAKLWQFWHGHPKPAFSEKEEMGDER